MSAKRIEEYEKLSQETRFLSQLSAFLISIFSLLSLYEIIRGIYFEFFYLETPQDFEHFKSFLEESGIVYAVIFQLSIASIFAFRFALHFFKSRRVFWLNQITWLIGFIILVSYWLALKPPDNIFGLYSTYPSPVFFRHASQSFEFSGIGYLLLSPIQKVIILIMSLTKVGESKV